jgi:hypothetical protein
MQKPVIALFSHHPECSIQCCDGMVKALSPHYEFKFFSEQDISPNMFDGISIVAFPGGIGNSGSFEELLEDRVDLVKEYLAGGGRYLGICMGAYWAGKHYFDLLNRVDAVQYITQPKADTRRPHAKAVNVEWLGQEEQMFFYDGCALVGDTTKFQTIATYVNGDAMAIRQGRIGLIGCHPESEQFWYDSYSWMRGLYHGGRHHGMLLDFVDQMFVTK